MERRETKKERENVDYNVNHKRDPQPATFSAYLECRSVSLDTIDRCFAKHRKQEFPMFSRVCKEKSNCKEKVEKRKQSCQERIEVSSGDEKRDLFALVECEILRRWFGYRDVCLNNFEHTY